MYGPYLDLFPSDTETSIDTQNLIMTHGLKQIESDNDTWINTNRI